MEDKYAYRVMNDDSFLAQSKPFLKVNDLGEVFLHVAEGQVRGGLMLSKVDFKTGEMQKITVGEVFEILSARVQYGGRGLVTPRMYRENMRRREKQAAMMSMFGGANVRHMSL
jgi:nucleoside-diphosphate-sugar epimerase